MSTINPIEFKEIVRQRDVLSDAISTVVGSTGTISRGFLAAALVNANPPPEFLGELNKSIQSQEHQTLPLPIGERVIAIPFPMSQEDFELLMNTLHLWKRKLVVQQVEGLK